MTMASGFFSPLELEYIDGRLWRVTADFDYKPADAKLGEVIRVYAGMLTDFASVPRVLWNILPPTGSYGKAAVIHDGLYQRSGVLEGRTYTRSESDSLLLDGMKTLGVGYFTRNAIYLGVRAGGQAAWDSDREKALKHIAKASALEEEHGTPAVSIRNS